MRRWMPDSIPFNMRIAMGRRGLICRLYWSQERRRYRQNATYLSLGDFGETETLLTGISFLTIAILSMRKIPGAIIIGILGTTILAAFLGLIAFNGLIAPPPSLAPTFMQLDILGALDVAMASVIIAFLFVNLFDTAGTLLGVASRAGLINEQGDAENMHRALKADSRVGKERVQSHAGCHANGPVGVQPHNITGKRRG